MKRNKLINIHLYCACFCSVVLLVFAFTGALHLLNYKELESVQKIEVLKNNDFLSPSNIDSNISKYLSTRDSKYSYEYLKIKGKTVVTRPTTRDYYKFEVLPSGETEVTKVVPSLRKRLFEFHKGHGRKFSRVVNAIFGLVLIFTILTGLWLGLQNKQIRNATIATSLISLIIFLFEFYL